MKRALWLIVLYAGICAALFAQDANNKSGESKVYKIGDVGPAGGIVFYDKGVYSNDKSDGGGADWRYLEAAPAETEFSAEWGAYNFNVIGTGPTIGSGKGNTQLIIERLRTLGESGCAAQLCVKLNYKGFADWFLPSKDELDLMYKNLKQKNLGRFDAENSYWSSSEVNTECAWYQSFKNGRQYNYGNYKYNAFKVRAIRAF
jgi:hypothetical protein